MGGDEAARNSYREAALLIGYAPKSGPRLRLDVRVGVARVNMKLWRDNGSGGFESEKVSVTGLAAEAGLYGRFVQYVGYSLILHGNANEEQSFAGATIGLTLGKLR